MVGDVRQATLLTNPRDPRNKQYKGVAIKNWFDARQAAGEIEITVSRRGVATRRSPHSPTASFPPRGASRRPCR
jgi:hypothetical protein